METMIINIESEDDKQLFLSLAKRLRLKATFLTDDEKEEYGLLKSMLEGQTKEYASKEAIMEALKK